MKTKILFLPLLAVCLIMTQSCCEDECPASTTAILYALTKSAIHGDKSWEDPIGSQIGASLPVSWFSNSMSLNAGAMISLQGAGWKEGELEGKTNLWYAYLPVMLRYQHTSGFYGEAGLQPGYLFRAMDKYEGISESYMDHMKRFDLSLPVAIGYKFSNNFGINLTVIPGITDITKDENVKDVNFVMGLGVTYTLRIRD
ncbi:PorT family protein [bacterium]|nr:PorT family protein [bacterium]